MLVLSRREGETLVFPELDIVLEILSVKGTTARLGVEAPAKIRVLRGELAQSREKLGAMVNGVGDDPSGKLTHGIRNWLHFANLQMELIRRYLATDHVDLAVNLIQKMLDDFRALENGEKPPAERDDLQFPEPATVKEAAAVIAGAARSRRALLVEDNANERQLLAGYLREHGFQIVTAADGGAALEYLSGSALPDMVLLDMLMPNCDGATVVRRIRHNHAYDRLKVFAVSGSSPASYDISTGPDGVDRWFRKPVDPQFLVHEILDVFEQPADDRTAV